jgi:hypothetical protein
MNKKILVSTVIAIVTLVVGSTTALAYNGGAHETLQDLTGMTAEEIVVEREAGRRLGEVAENKGVYDEFRSSMQTKKMDAIESRVKEGSMTREDADKIIAEISSCDGVRPEAGRQIFGAGLKDGNGYKSGNGVGASEGRGAGKNR